MMFFIVVGYSVFLIFTKNETGRPDLSCYEGVFVAARHGRCPGGARYGVRRISPLAGILQR
jgi:hypothetical protein